MKCPYARILRKYSVPFIAHRGLFQTTTQGIKTQISARNCRNSINTLYGNMTFSWTSHEAWRRWNEKKNTMFSVLMTAYLLCILQWNNINLRRTFMKHLVWIIIDGNSGSVHDKTWPALSRTKQSLDNISRRLGQGFGEIGQNKTCTIFEQIFDGTRI